MSQRLQVSHYLQVSHHLKGRVFRKEFNMTGTVSSLSIAFMAISCLISFGVPIALFIYLRVAKKADIYPFFAGCTVMLLFAFLLESGAHRVILSSPIGDTIRNNIWLYALYGGLMAGLFEETGRYLAFSFALKRYRAKNVNALMYGAGHGGFEAIVIAGLTMINNLVWSSLINSGNISAITGSLSGEALTQAEQSISLLTTTPSYHFLLGGIERVFAIVLHLALSVLVWFAAKWDGKLHLYGIAILIHFAVDAISVILSQTGVNLVIVEIAVGIATVAAALYARKVWQSTR